MSKQKESVLMVTDRKRGIIYVPITMADVRNLENGCQVIISELRAYVEEALAGVEAK